jgi:serine phosphatase RsbU (regulator of sigma subunit)
VAYDQLEETTTAKERIESELRIARDIQMGMVPSTFPEDEGLDIFASMTPAKAVGGDLYDFFILDGTLYFCLGDVSGKGVPASLFMAQSIRLFRALAKQQMMPADIATRLNAELSENNESGMFVTMFIGEVDLQTGHLEFCNAGHNPPVFRGEFIEMEPNAPIGLWPELEYIGENIDNIKGEPLFIYTDGLNEAENAAQEQFGDDHLLEVIGTNTYESARQTVELLQHEVAVHVAGAEPSDDLTMLCLKIKE